MEAFKDFFSCPQVIAALVAVLTVLYLVYSQCFDGRIQNLHKKFIIITGCDTGFGKMTALRLDQLGFHVIATCLTAEGEEALQEEASSKLTTFQLDVTKSSQIQDVFRKVESLIPQDEGLWGVINNAGVATVGPVDWISLDRLKRTADVNLWGTIDVSKTFLPLVKKTQGRIVNIASIGGRTCLPHAVAYCVSKFGVEAFSDALRREMFEFGVKVSIVEPGFFRTPMVSKANLRNSWSDLWDSLDKEKLAEYGQECYQAYVDNLLVGVVDTCSSPNSYKVIDAIVHAMTSTQPKSRYVIGWDAHLLWIWLSRLPTSIGDVILRLLANKRAVPRSVQR